MISRYEENILKQPREWKRLLDSSLPGGLKNIITKRVYFVGIGSSYWATRFAEFLWREHINGDAIAVQSFDFVRTSYPITQNDVVVVFSHRGTKSFSVSSLELAKAHGATTVFITGIGVPSHSADFHIETCEQENCPAFTVSLTAAIVRIVQWIGLSKPTLLDKLRETADKLKLAFGVPLPNISDLVLVGDCIREVISREIALKIYETSYLPVRAFGLEELLHGQRVTLGKETNVVFFSTQRETRNESLIEYAQTVGSKVMNVPQEDFNVPEEFGWLAQLVWGQLFALELSRKLGTNPDANRSDVSPYKEAKELLQM